MPDLPAFPVAAMTDPGSVGVRKLSGSRAVGPNDGPAEPGALAAGAFVDRLVQMRLLQELIEAAVADLECRFPGIVDGYASRGASARRRGTGVPATRRGHRAGIGPAQLTGPVSRQEGRRRRRTPSRRAN